METLDANVIAFRTMAPKFEFYCFVILLKRISIYFLVFVLFRSLVRKKIDEYEFINITKQNENTIFFFIKRNYFYYLIFNNNFFK